MKFILAQFVLLAVLYLSTGTDALMGGNLMTCPFHRCRNINDGRLYLLKRTLSANFPYANQQNQRKSSTRYILFENVLPGAPGVNLALRKPGSFLAYDSHYDPAFNPCTDCDDSGNGETCNFAKCYSSSIYLVGKN